MKRTITVACILSLLALLSSTAFSAVTPLAPTTGYKIEVFKVMSSGQLTSDSSASATTDASGKLNFNLTSIPTIADRANFIYLELKDQTNTTVRQGFAPAPPNATNANNLGINEMADKQAQVFKQALALAGSDDPIMAAYLMIILRSPGVTAADVPIIAAMGKNGIRGANGFEGFLISKGITALQLSKLKGCLIYNTDASKKTLRDFSKSYYDAVNAPVAGTENALMQQAGGFMAEIFIDAAICADIQPELILAAHNAAGDATGMAALMTTLSGQNSAFASALDSAMTSFHMRIAASKVAYEYTDALTTLNATGTQVTTFLNAGQALMTAMANIEATYAGFYIDPQGYATAHNTTVTAIEAAKNAAYTTAFTNFQSAISSSTTDITNLKNKILTQILPAGASLPSDFGTYRDFSGAQKNWPIPQTVMVDWLANILIAKGSLTYTRDTTPIPVFAEQWWMGTCSLPLTLVPDQATCMGGMVPGGMWDGSKCITNGNKASCTTAGGTWTARHDFGTQNPFASLLGLQEDISILEMTRYALYNTNPNPTQAQEAAAKAAFQAAMDACTLRMGGTKNGTTLISSHEKDAIITVMKQPSME